jgi:hypothetical protein
MKNLIAFATLLTCCFGCNSNNQQTSALKVDTSKTVNNSLKSETITTPSFLDSVPADMKTGTLINKNGKIFTTYDGQLIETSYKEMMMHEIEKNDKGEIFIKDGTQKIPFTAGMMVDKNDNILMLKNGQLQKLNKDGK